MKLIKFIYALMFKAVRFSPYLTWKLGTLSELWYMFKWLKARRDWTGPEDLEFCCEANSNLQSFIVELLDAPPGSTVRILDVGAGSLTCLGKVWQGRKVEIIPVDALAREYSILLKLCRVKAPIITTFAQAESLTLKYPRNYFDLVHARNSIDHTFNPFLAIKQMIDVVRPNCFVFMKHYVNEGETANYTGLHQWNFSATQDNLFLSRPGTIINISKELEKIAEVRCEYDAQGMLISRIMKKC